MLNQPSRSGGMNRWR